MVIPLLVAGWLAALLGLAHSWLGERYVISRLLRRTDLPKLFGSDLFTRRTLRFAWHLTSVAWFGFAATLWVLGSPHGGEADLAGSILGVVARTFALSGLVALVGSRGRHLSWIVFLAIALLVWLARPAGSWGGLLWPWWA